jgi:hypothetical protein
MNAQKLQAWAEKNLTNIKVAFNGKHYVTIANFQFGYLGEGADGTVGEHNGKLWYCVWVSEQVGTVLAELNEVV